MTKPTYPNTYTNTYRKLFEDGDYYITDEAINDVGFKRNSVIMHPCPHPNSMSGVWGEKDPFNITITMPNGETGKCYYCNQRPSDELITVYKLHNWDHFANDPHETVRAVTYNTGAPKFPRRNV